MIALAETGTETTAPPHIKQPPTTAGFFYGHAIFRVTDVKYFKATQFKHQALKRARFEDLEDGSIYGEIPECPGVWAKAKTQRACREELKEVLSEWIDVKLKDGDKDFPIMEGVDLNVL